MSVELLDNRYHQPKFIFTAFKVMNYYSFKIIKVVKSASSINGDIVSFVTLPPIFCKISLNKFYRRHIPW